MKNTVRRGKTSAAQTSQPALSPEDWSLQKNVAFRMDSISSRMNQELRDSVLRDMDLTHTHFRVLQVLFEVDGQQIGDIARSIVVRQPALSRVIDQLQARKLVRRKQAKDDSRYMRVYLTAAGRHSYEQAWPAAHQIVVRALEGLADDERERLLELLTRMDVHMQKK